jgi:glycerate kinase
MHILIAPDKYKGSLSAVTVADAMTRGARKVHPEASFSIRPAADGGEGTVAAFVTAVGGKVRDVTVAGPLGDATQAQLALLRDGSAVIEMAHAAGLSLVEPGPASAVRANTMGVGHLLAEAVASGSSRIFVGIGGSASTDGGTGAARAFGWRFLDRGGAELPRGGGALIDLEHIEPPNEGRSLDAIGICDVDNPLVGPDGAARAFGPQKGADPDIVQLLEQGLERLAAVIETDLGVDVARLPHGGAGGGLGAGLVAFFGASLRPGLDLLAEATGLQAEIERADLVITGEGRMDPSSLRGKAPVALARMARASGKPCVAIVGDLRIEKQQVKKAGFESAVGLIQSGGSTLNDSDPERAIEKATEGVLRNRVEKKEGRSFRK